MAQRPWGSCVTWLLPGIILRLCSLHGVQHRVLCLAVLVGSVCCVQRCIRSVLVTIARKAVCTYMSHPAA